METGLLSDSKSVGKGVQEVRLHFGYRIYFGYDGDKLVILLLGSDEDDQHKAILKAQEYWTDYKKQKKKLSKLPSTKASTGENYHETCKRTDSSRTKK